MKKIINCDYCKKPTLAKDITYWKKEDLHLCVFCLKNTKRPKNYLSNIKNKNHIEINNNVNYANNEDNEEDIKFYRDEIENDEIIADLINDNNEDDDDFNRQLYDDTLERDALEFSDPDDFYRNDDYDNETLWHDKDDDYDDGWRR